MAQKIYVDRDYLTTELAKKANTSHASSSTTYGASSASNYGHAKASSTTPKANGTAAVGSETSSFARGDHVHPAQTTITGNAGSATKVNNNLTIKLNGGSTEGTNLFTFNGSAAKTVNVTPNGIGALALTGGTLSGKLKINGPASDQPFQVRGIVGSSADSSSVDGLYLQYGANKEVYFGNSGGYTISADGSNYTGNAATATTLKTARTINGTSFNGSANITTANWGTARNLTIGNKTQSVNGSGNVTWSLADIGAVSKTEFDSFNIGGRNYITDSKKETSTTSTYMTRPLSPDAKTDLAGKVVTASFDLKLTTAGGNIYCYFRSSGGAISPESSKLGAGTTSYKRYSVTFTAPTDLSTAETFSVHISTASGTYYLKNLKLELGNRASSWCPAVEDALVLGETSTTAYRGDRGKTAYNHSQAAHAPSNAQKNSDITKAEIEAKLTGAITSHTHSYLPLTGGTVSGAITSTIGGGQGGFIISNSTARTMLYASSNVGEHIFGGNNDGTNQVKDFVRVGANKLKYETGGNVYDIYHAGNKPSLSALGAASSSHTHSYLPLSGGTLTGRLTLNYTGGPRVVMNDGTNEIWIGINGEASKWGIYDNKAGAYILSKTVSSGAVEMAGNATTATTLKTSRTINGTSFNGSANITTANWGTARTITIGNAGKSVNGSGNVSWTLAEIGAAAASHTHSYAASSHGHSNYVQGDNTSRTTNQDGNANDISASGFYRVSNTASTNNPMPDSKHSHILHGQHPSTAGYKYQIAIPYADTNKIYFRNNPNSSWGSWYKIYNSGDKPTLSELGAAASSHTHSYLPLSGGTLTNGNFGALTIARSGSANGASIGFVNSSGYLGYIGMRGSANEGLVRWSADTNTMYTVLDTGNFKTHVTPSAIGAAASSHGTHLTIGTGASNAAAGNHTHSYLPLAGGTMTGAVTLNNNIVIRSKTPAAYTNTSTSASVASGTTVNILTYNSSGNCHVNSGAYDNYLSTGNLYLNSPNSIYLRTVNSGGHYMQINGTTVAHFKNDETAFTKITYAKAGIKSGGNIVSDTALTDNLGTAAIPWKIAYAKQIYVYGEANKRYGYISTPTVGTADTVGECLLVVGNDTASGTAGNAKGRLFLYGTNTGGTYIATANDTTSNYTITLPAKSGTVACTSDYVKSKKLTQSEYNSATKNSSTLYIIVG